MEKIELFLKIEWHNIVILEHFKNILNIIVYYFNNLIIFIIILTEQIYI